MIPRTATSLLLALSLAIAFSSARLWAADRPVESLPAHLLQSGIPTAGELSLVENWLKAVAAGQEGPQPAETWFDQWLATGLPFTFRYEGRNFTVLAATGNSTVAKSAARPTRKARTGSGSTPRPA